MDSRYADIQQIEDLITVGSTAIQKQLQPYLTLELRMGLANVDTKSAEIKVDINGG